MAELVDWATGTFVEVLRQRAAETPDDVVYTFLLDGEDRTQTMMYAELDRRARGSRARSSVSPSPGIALCLFYPDGPDYIAGVFGCFYAGLVAVSGAAPLGPRSLPRVFSILRDSSPAVIVGTRSLLTEYQTLLRDEWGTLPVKWVPTDALEGRLAEGWTGPPSENESLAVLQYTSGSTGHPRGVMLTHRNLLHNLQGQILAFGYQRGDAGVSWLPFSHDMGLIGALLMAVYAGGPCVLLSSSLFIEKPVRWLRAITKYRATLSGAPNFAYDLCVRRISREEHRGLDLSCLEDRLQRSRDGAVRHGRQVHGRVLSVRLSSRSHVPVLRPCRSDVVRRGRIPLTPPRTLTVSVDALGRNRAVRVDEAPEAGGDTKVTRLVGCGRTMSGTR